MKQVDDVDKAGFLFVNTPPEVVRDFADRTAAKLAEKPRLSPSIAKIAIEKSWLHAHYYHRLLGGHKKDDTAATIDGRIYEAMMIGNPARALGVVNFNDYRSAEANAERDRILAAGLIPIKKDDYAEYCDRSMAMLARITSYGVEFKGEVQHVELWESDGAQCKGVFDHLFVGGGSYMIDDIKCVADASPAKIQRDMTVYGWDIQGASYVEGFETNHPELAGRGCMRFIFVEKDAPHAVTIVYFRGSMAELGRQKWARAKRGWNKCLATNTWPGYPVQDSIDAAAWQLGKELDHQLEGEGDE